MKYCNFCFVLALLGLSLSLTFPVFAQSSGIERVSNLSHDIGKTVTLVGRTGYIVSESSGMYIFTLRDDYDGLAYVRELGTDRPTMGVTYRVTGTPTRINGTLYLESAASLIAPAYPDVTPVPSPPPPSLKSWFLTWAPFLLSVLAILIVLFSALRRWTRQPAPEWGVLSVTSGPDRGLNVPLQRKRIAVGRGVSPARDIRLSSGDQTISNRHVLLEYKHGHLYVCDMSSNGTRIGGEKLMPGKSVQVNSGDLIHLGTRGTVIIVRLHELAPSAGLLSFLREAAPLSDKTIILPEQSLEEPAWKHTPADSVLEAKPLPSDSAEDDFAASSNSLAEDNAAHEESASESSSYSFSSYTAKDDEGEPAPAPATANGASHGWAEDEDDEDDIPHTFAPPLIFTFAGHDPKPSRLYGVDTPEHGEPQEEDGDASV